MVLKTVICWPLNTSCQANFLIYNSTTKPFTVWWNLQYEILQYDGQKHFGKFISRKSYDRVSWKCRKAYMCCVLQFGTNCLITKNKNTCGKRINFSEGCRVACNFSKSNTPLQMFLTFLMMQIVPNPKQGTFLGCFVCFSKVPWKLEYFHVWSFYRRWKHHQYFHFTPIPARS